MNKKILLIVLGIVLLLVAGVILLNYSLGNKTGISPSTTAALFESIRNSVNQHLAK